MKYLRNRKTGVVFPFHPLLAKNKDMEPCDHHGTSAFEEVDATGDAPQAPGAAAAAAIPAPSVSENGIIIDKATKAELIEFAQANYGVRLEDSQKVGELREQVKKLIEDDE